MTNNTPDYKDNLYFEDYVSGIKVEKSDKMTDCKNCKYTDEYCVSGDCNKTQANDLACNKISLTEKWKKGELPVGEYYYVGDGAEITIDYYLCDYWERHFDSDVQQVLAPVPSYEEWKQLKEYERIVTSYNMKPIDYDIACETVNKLLDDNKHLKHDVGNLGYKIKNQRHEIDNRLKEIEKLKELLKECEDLLKRQPLCRNINETDVELRDRLLKKHHVLTKIDGVLK